jgi:hypothetical protein
MRSRGEIASRLPDRARVLEMDDRSACRGSPLGRIARAALLAATACSPPRETSVLASSQVTQTAPPMRSIAPLGSVAPTSAPRSPLTLQVWVDAPLTPYALGDTLLLSDGHAVATATAHGFVQDGLLSAAPDCDVRDVFVGFAGALGGNAWAARNGPSGAALLRLAKQRWVVEAHFPGARLLLAPKPSGGLIAVIPGHGAANRRYELRLLNPTRVAPTAPQIVPDACVEPDELVADRSGAIALLGHGCVDTARYAIHFWSPASPVAQVIEVPADLKAPHVALTAEGRLLLGAARGGRGYIGAWQEAGFRELGAFGGPVTSLAAADDGSVWTVLASAGAAPPPDPLRRLRAGEWETVALPSGVGQATSVSSGDAEGVWVSTEYATLRALAPLRPLAWAVAYACPSPVTDAKPYTLQRLPSSQLRATAHSALVGPDCPHFLLFDSTTAPRSEVLPRVLERLRQTLHRDDVVRAEASYDAALSQRSRGSLGSPGPIVTYERGHYYWGIWAEPGDDMEAVAPFLRKTFNKELRELCAAPYPIRVDALTRSTLAAPLR